MGSLGGTWTAVEVRVGSAAVLGYAYGLCGPMGERILAISGRGGSSKYLKHDKKRPTNQDQKAKKKMSFLGGTWTADEVRVRSAAVLGCAYGLCGPMGERIRTISVRGGSPKYLKRDKKTTTNLGKKKTENKLTPWAMYRVICERLQIDIAPIISPIGPLAS